MTQNPQIKSWEYFRSSPNVPPKHLFLLLHGCGGNSQDIMPLAQMLEKEMKGESFVAVAPDGFMPSVEKSDGYQWFDIENNYSAAMFEKPVEKLTAKERQSYMKMTEGETGLFQASQELNRFLDFCQKEFGVPNKDTTIIGYSQGGMAALDMGLNRPEPVKRIVSVSGSLIPPFEDVLEKRHRSSPDVTLVHGTKDKVIDFNAAQLTENLLRRRNLNVRFFRQIGMSHGRGKEAACFWSKAAHVIAREVMPKKTLRNEIIKRRKGHSK